MEYGYGRVSSREQNLIRQILALKEAGIDERYIFTDKQSGKNFNRPNYNLLVGTETTAPLLRAGDLLTIYSIDRLGRNYTEIMQQWQYITQKLKVDIRVLDMPLLDTRTGDDGKSLDKRFVADLVLQILSYVAEKERININVRQRQGIDCMEESDELLNLDGTKKKISSKTGRPTGRPQAEFPENWSEAYSKWKNGELTATKSMELLGVTRNTFYNLVKRYEAA